MHKLYLLLFTVLFLLYSTTMMAQEQASSSAKRKYTSIKIGPSLTALSPKGEPWFGGQIGAHAGISYLTMENDWLGIQLEAQYSLQGAKINRGHLLLHYLNVPVLAKVFLAPNVSLQGGAYAGLLLSERYEFESYSSRPNMKGADHGLLYGLTYGDEAGLTFSLRHQVGLVKVIHAKNQVFQLSLSYCISSK
ncbi:outer membrane beta-barrel protein [Pontibacter sp. BAB1700]|uniref:outer membrane beta-barrel protein n=1 Tax=Pontibacter sp. BAB1700 TaxID=1144253 RepID=UPI00026BBCB2|nr:outer membrane beta-barrel protein [Pontibacter sp. BAB1700]EJF11843.1 hypothetical protein O71_00787 [Pontibacter sp. BAB1700]